MSRRHSIVPVLVISLFCCIETCAGQVAVRYSEGISHGFLTLRTLNGRLIAEGESAQTAKDGIVTNKLTFRFKDGSFYEETTTFSQRGNFRLLKDHVVRKGPSFKDQMDSIIDAKNGKVNVRYEENGKPKELQESMELPVNLGNGLVFTLAKNLLHASVTTVSYLALTPKPTLVKLVFTKQKAEKLKAGSTRQPGACFLLKIEIGGIKGIVASLLKKTPPDTQIWILDDETPTFVASEGPLYAEGPVWKIDLISPERIRSNPPDPR